MAKRIGIFNINGNVAKSTTANYLYGPRILSKGGEIIYVESDNSIPGKIPGMKVFSMEDFGEVQEYLSITLKHDVVVDFGSTDSKKLKSLFIEYAGSHEEFDMFVVPASPESKHDDTASTIAFLRKLGVPAENIKLLFTMVPIGGNIEKIFVDLIDYVKEQKLCEVNPKLVIYFSPLFARIKGTDLTLTSILEDATDWKQEVIKTSEFDEATATPKEKTKNKEIRDYCGQQMTIKKLALGVKRDMDECFKILMG